VETARRDTGGRHPAATDGAASLFDFATYEAPGRSWDEMFDEHGAPRPHYGAVHEALGALSVAGFSERCEARDRSFRDQGITFSHSGGPERPFPLDLLPRIIPASEWEVIESGVAQRVRALEAFLDDVYGDRQVLADGIVPRSLLLSSAHMCREVAGLRPANGVRIHVAGIDLVRDAAGRYRVLEDNLRTPSGISYVIENRRAMTHVFPELFATQRVRPVADYPAHLLEALRAAAPPAAGPEPRVVVLTPGVHNAAYFEHAFLARQMGVALVEGRDLVCRDGEVLMRSTSGTPRVDVVYRRVDDAFLDPLQFRGDSVLGCAGIVNAARAGHVTIANAVGNGVADDKAMYGHVPHLIRYYLGEEPILANVDTFDLLDPDQRAHVLGRLDEMVVKPVGGSGGYGIMIGPAATDEERERTREAVLADPRGFVAQEVVALSTSPTHTGDGFAPRHVDLRPFAVNDGERIWVAPGGLTRVALPEGSLVVNSSQGGGSKDTWVLTPSGDAFDRLVAQGARQPGTVWSRPLDQGPGEAVASELQDAQQQQQQAGPAGPSC
jgi:uncharacterized circularly permuted ATP-grasp superfamily protein